jgi:hypothetical protein
VSPWLLLALAWSAFAAVAPLSGDAHFVAAAVLMPGSEPPAVFSTVFHAAAAGALVIVGRSSFREIPLLPLALGLAGAEVLRLLSSEVRGSVLTIAVGLLGTAAMLVALGVAPRNVARRSPIREAALAAATLALAGAPGASPVACALAARAWSGRRIPAPAAALWAAPFEARAAWGAGVISAQGVSALELGVGAGLAVVGAAAGTRLLRLGPEQVGRIGAAYLSIFGAALLAYAYALR